MHRKSGTITLEELKIYDTAVLYLEQAYIWDLQTDPERILGFAAKVGGKFKKLIDDINSELPNTIALSTIEQSYLIKVVDMDTPPKDLKELASLVNPILQQIIGRNPNTPEETLEHLSKNSDVAVRGAVAKNPVTPPGVLSVLASDYSLYVLRSLAQNIFASEKILTLLSKTKDATVLENLAANTSIPSALLDKFSRKKDPRLNEIIADNPSTSTKTLLYLSKLSKRTTRLDNSLKARLKDGYTL